MFTEKTQFSMAELTEFLKVEADPAACNKRETAMLAFSREVIDFSNLGGIDNIQRVRVLADATGAVKYEFITKLPVAALAEAKRREEAAVRKAQQENVMVLFRTLLAHDPKEAAEYLKTSGYKTLDRTQVIFLLETCAEALKAAKKVRKNIEAAGKRVATSKRPIVQRVPKAKQDAYALALEQDRLNRIKASKEAAAALRKKAS